MWGRKARPPKRATFFGKLAHDTRGNTLAMMAIALIPLSALAGSAVDMGRLYIVKTRLQQACDAGVLAGRKTMVSTDGPLDAAAATQAKTFFANNFPSGLMNTPVFAMTTTPYPFVPTRTSDNQVAGTATARVPMSIMKMFGAPDVTLNVTCEARYDVADTDVMFVLDTTGSMACAPSDSTNDCTTYATNATKVSYARPADGTGSGNLSVAGYPTTTGYYVTEKNDSRIKAVRLAVLSFFDTMKSTIDPTTNVRYGFVTYTSTVNAGRAIMDRSAAYMVGGTAGEKWNYQSRIPDGEYSSNDSDNKGYKTQSSCNTYAQARTPATGYTDTGASTGPSATKKTSSRDNDNDCIVVTTTYLPKWKYQQAAYDVSAFITGGAATDPTKAVPTTSRWLGCIEERDTTAGATSFSTTALPADLDSDLIPSSAVSTRWRPMWPEVVYDRINNSETRNGDDSDRPSLNTVTRRQLGYFTCGKPVQRLKVMDRAAVNAYVYASDFRAIGGTYHDVGMIWGTRMLSPNGIFASDTAAWPLRQEPNRVLIFMTDGDMSPASDIYGLYGLEQWDKRVSNGSFTNAATYKNFHNQRFLAECSKAKDLGIDVWVVAVGQAVTQQLKDCASSQSQAIYAGTSPDVSTAFADIAKHVAALRISK